MLVTVDCFDRWPTARVVEGVMRTRKPKSVLRCTDPDLRNRIQKYEMAADIGDFTSEALSEHLMEKVAGAAQAVSLEDIVGNLSFDARLTDPREKVGQVFQRVDKIIALNGIAGVFPVKEITNQIVNCGTASGAAPQSGVRAINDQR